MIVGVCLMGFFYLDGLFGFTDLNDLTGRL